MSVDLILRGGEVHDGLGSPARRTDVAIDGGRIAAIGSDLGPARRSLDADGLVVAPGSIDIHSHSDGVPFLDGVHGYKLAQGVTTEVVGNCGIGIAPWNAGMAARATGLACGRAVAGGVDRLLDDVDAAGSFTNLAYLVGHGTLREHANGDELPLADGALASMSALLADGLDAGAFGLSTGLIYPPANAAGIEEIVALAEVTHAFGGVYATHMRNEGPYLLAAVDEAIEVARRARVRLQISHCKSMGRAHRGHGRELLERIESARVAGVDVRGDAYPYAVSSTFQRQLLPDFARAGGDDAIRARLADPARRAEIRAALAEGPAVEGQGQIADLLPGDVLLLTHADPAFAGKTLERVAAERGTDAIDAMMDVLLADPGGHMALSSMDPAEVEMIVRHPLIGIGSDGGPPVGLSHPRTYGAFPAFLSSGWVPFEEAIRKVSSANAAQVGLVGRGVITPGAVADVQVLDRSALGHAGDFTNPAQAPTGVVHVLLAGEFALEWGTVTGVRRGRALRRGRSPI